LDSGHFDHLTHYAFRYPAKFHPPAVRALIKRYTKTSETILDPFCGSGTLLLEAGATGRHAIGSDVDPVAVFVSRVKTHRYSTPRLRRSWKLLEQNLQPYVRSDNDYKSLMFTDLATGKFARETSRLWVPAIPNISHWFRRSVIVDLARINHCVQKLDSPATHRDFFMLCFASIVRSSSNADPVPVSGLEVTAHMKRKDETGRQINAFDLFTKSVTRRISDFEAQQELIPQSARLSAFRADATTVSSKIRGPVDCVLTSPPYHNAVDYYRRHTLEMYWLGLTTTAKDRLGLLPKYVGRPRIPMSHGFVQGGVDLSPLASRWERRMAKVDRGRARDFRHYIVSMQKVFRQMARILPAGKRAVMVVGRSSWNGSEIPTAALFNELAGDEFKLVEQLYYPIHNRYMSYSRHNGASIEKEHVIVFRRTRAAAGLDKR
jgi:SAM-dependent methyltransferase